MTVEEFLEERRNSYLETRKEELEELKEKLVRAAILPFGNIVWKQIDDDMEHIKSLDDLQSSFDMDWNEWVLMCPEFTDFSEEEQEEVKDHEKFLSTPVNVWKL